MADPARTMVLGSTIPLRAGVSPPPQTAPARRQPSAKPARKSWARVVLANQAESPTAACMATEIGRAPVVDKIVDDRGDGVDADVGVIALAGEFEHGIGDQVFGSEAFFDVGEEFVGTIR